MKKKGSIAEFKRMHSKLNAAQKEAVDKIEGPVMVVAGPGTGKTQILTLRIANILKETDASPDSILALTFTESGVVQMRRRLLSIIGSDAYRVRLFTFHGFCNDVIQRYPEEFPRIIGGEATTDIEKISILREIITQNEFDHLKPFGNNFHYINDIRGSISELKRENISVEALKKHVEKELERFNDIPDLYNEKGAHAGKMKGKYQTEGKRLERTKELAAVYEAYEEALRERRLYDFEDMIVEVVNALQENEDLLLKLQEEYQYVLADEHQDANAAQNKLLELLSNFHENPNIFIVGDEKQAIFRFQGASLENFLYFKRLYPEAELIQLTEAYRSGQKILDAAHSMMGATSEGEEELRAPLVSRASVSGEQVDVQVFGSVAAEREWVVEDIKRLIGEGVEPSEIAILYRTNSQAEGWVRACEDRGVAVSVESDQNALGDPDIRKFITLLRALTRFGDDENMSEILHLPYVGVTPLDAYKIIHYARKEKLLVADVMHSEELLIAARVDDVEKVLSLYETLERFAASEGSVPEIVSDLVRDSGFLTYILNSRRAVELIEKLAGLMRDIDSLASGDNEYSLSSLAGHLALLDEYRVPIKKEVRAAPRQGAVRLMTAHKSKGLEFDYVYIVNGVDGNWGGRRSRQHFALPVGALTGEDDDERRLLYVALTRARAGVSLSYAEEREGKALLPTRFLEEIDEKVLEVQTHIEEHSVADDLARERAPASVALPDKSFLNELFLEQGLSVTALNNYLVCPWRYFYSNLIRIPKSLTPPLLYGNAADRALKRYFEEYKEIGKLDEDRLVELFKDSAERLPLKEKQLEEMVVRGEEHLRAWHKAWHKTFERNTQSGYRIETTLSLNEGDLGSVILRGELDKVEFISQSNVRVVDYKTGKPKSRNAIEGKTKTDDGGYFRQLKFYRLLLELEEKYSLDEAMLDFVQPDERGKLHRESYSRDELETKELVQEVERVSNEIWNLSFWEERCGDPECEYCALRNLMR